MVFLIPLGLFLIMILISVRYLFGQVDVVKRSNPAIKFNLTLEIIYWVGSKLRYPNTNMV